MVNKFLIFFFQSVVSNVHGGWRGKYYFRVNLKVDFTLTYLIPGETFKETLNVNGDSGFVAMEIVLQNVFKIHIQSGDISIWSQVTFNEFTPIGWTFDWIQLLYKNNEIGRIVDPTVYTGYFLSNVYVQYLVVDNKPLNKYYESFDIDITKLCVSKKFVKIDWAYGWNNPIGYYDDCYRVFYFPPKPPQKRTTIPPTTLPSEPLMQKQQQLTEKLSTTTGEQIKTENFEILTRNPLSNVIINQNDTKQGQTSDRTSSYKINNKSIFKRNNISHVQKYDHSKKSRSTVENNRKNYWIIGGGIICSIIIIFIIVICAFLCIRKNSSKQTS